MITFTKVDEAVGGQGRPVVYLSVQKYDLIFAIFTAYRGGNAQILPSQLSVKEIGLRRHPGLSAPIGEMIGAIWEAQATGTLRIAISANSDRNMDLFATVLRPSEPTVDVEAHITEKRSDQYTWTDYLDFEAGEFALCGQYCSGGDRVPGSPQASAKDGTAGWVVQDWALPEGATGWGNGFMELIRITSPGTLRYRGANPMMLRVTVQGRPELYPTFTLV